MNPFEFTLRTSARSAVVEDEMRSSDVQAIANEVVQRELVRSHLRTYTFGQVATPANLSQASANTSQSAASTGALMLTITAGGGNRFRYMSLERTGNGQPDEMYGSSAAGIFGMRCLMYCFGTGTGGMGGISFGSPFYSGVDTDPPWENPSQKPFIQLRATNTAGAVHYFLILSAGDGDGVGGGTPTRTVAITHVALSNIHNNVPIELRVDPINKIIYVYINHELCHTDTEPAEFPDFNMFDLWPERWSCFVEQIDTNGFTSEFAAIQTYHYGGQWGDSYPAP